VAVNREQIQEIVRRTLNKKLLVKKNLSAEKIDLLVELNTEKYYLYQEMRGLEDTSKIKELASKVTGIDYLLQETWGFEQNKKYHKFWELPGCQCPVFENINIYPSDEYKHISTCPIHGVKRK